MRSVASRIALAIVLGIVCVAACSTSDDNNPDQPAAGAGGVGGSAGSSGKGGSAGAGGTAGAGGGGSAGEAGSAGSAPFSYVLGDTLYAYPNMVPKPEKGGSYTDPVFHSTITRITDHTTDNAGQYSRAGVEYSTWNPLSSDGKYLALEGGEGGYGIWHADPPYAFYKDVSGAAAGYNGQNGEFRWDQSGSHPTWFYYRKDLSLHRVDVETDEDVIVRDFTSELALPSTYYIYNGDEGACSDDSNVWAWIVKNVEPPYDEARVLVYDKAADAVNIKDISMFGGANSVKVSPWGNYLVVEYNPVDPYAGEGKNPYVYDISGHATSDNSAVFGHPFQVNGNIPHDAWAVTRQGHEVLVGLQPNGNHVDKLTMVRGDNGALYELYAQVDMDPQWSMGGINHMTGPSAKPGWTFMSSYSDNSAGAQASWAQAQVWAVEIDETKCMKAFTSYEDTTGTACAQAPRIWRIAFEQSFTGTDYYYQQPNAAIDKAGTRIWFGSNFRDESVDSMDVYQVTLPPTWLQDLGP